MYTFACLEERGSMAPTYQGVDVFELQVLGGDMEPQEIFCDFIVFEGFLTFPESNCRSCIMSVNQ